MCTAFGAILAFVLWCRVERVLRTRKGVIATIVFSAIFLAGFGVGLSLDIHLLSPYLFRTR